MNLLEDLNQAQQEAVKHFNGPLLVLAGAGSGKTRVLTNRIAYLLEHRKISHRNILAVTFTNKAAGEMKRRIEQLCTTESRSFWVGTFHSICGRILRKEAEHTDHNPNYIIYDKTDQLSLIKNILKDYDLSEKSNSARMYLSRISSLKNSMIDVNVFKSQINDFSDKKIAQVYEEYQKRLAQNNALDFDDLMVKTVRLFQNSPAILKRYQDQFKFILVDEYQDTNHCQYQLVNQLARSHRNLCVVGDDDQSIYGWR